MLDHVVFPKLAGKLSQGTPPCQSAQVSMPLCLSVQISLSKFYYERKLSRVFGGGRGVWRESTAKKVVIGRVVLKVAVRGVVEDVGLEWKDCRRENCFLFRVL